MPVEVDFLAEVFGFMTLDPIALFTALGLAFLSIPLMEIYKAVMRRVEKNVEVDFLAEVFGFMTLDPIALFTALGLAFLSIPLMEIYKAVMRRVEKNQD